METEKEQSGRKLESKGPRGERMSKWRSCLNSSILWIRWAGDEAHPYKPTRLKAQWVPNHLAYDNLRQGREARTNTVSGCCVNGRWRLKKQTRYETWWKAWLALVCSGYVCVAFSDLLHTFQQFRCSLRFLYSTFSYCPALHAHFSVSVIPLCTSGLSPTWAAP